MTPGTAFISILDCDLCRRIPKWQVCSTDGYTHEPSSPLPATWTCLSTIDVTDPTPYGGRDEVRMCPYCGTYYTFTVAFSDDSHDAGGGRPPSTSWSLWRARPHWAWTLLNQKPLNHTRHEREVLERRFPQIIETLRSDLSRARKEADLDLKQYVMQALLELYVLTRDWDGLTAIMIDHADPGVRLDTARWVLEKVYWTPGWMNEIETTAPSLLMDKAFPGLLTWLRGPNEEERWVARGILARFMYVKRDQTRAKQILEAVAGVNTAEARAVAQQCQNVLDRKASSGGRPIGS